MSASSVGARERFSCSFTDGAGTPRLSVSRGGRRCYLDGFACDVVGAVHLSDFPLPPVCLCKYLILLKDFLMLAEDVQILCKSTTCTCSSSVMSGFRPKTAHADISHSPTASDSTRPALGFKPRAGGTPHSIPRLFGSASTEAVCTPGSFRAPHAPHRRSIRGVVGPQLQLEGKTRVSKKRRLLFIGRRPCELVEIFLSSD